MISVLLPSIRPRNLRFCVDRFIATQKDINYELVLSTDFIIPSYYLRRWRSPKWIYDPVRKGCVNAIYKAEQASEGKYLFILNDMAEVSKDGLRSMLNFSKLYGDRVVVNQHTVPTTKLEYYNKAFAPYPFTHRDIVKKLGGLFLPVYKSFYADPDLSLRAHEARIPIIKCPGVTVLRHSPRRFFGLCYDGHKENIKKYCEEDKQTFINKWKHLGEFKEPG